MPSNSWSISKVNGKDSIGSRSKPRYLRTDLEEPIVELIYGLQRKDKMSTVRLGIHYIRDVQEIKTVNLKAWR